MTHNVVDTQVTPTGRMEVLSRAEASSLLDRGHGVRDRDGVAGKQDGPEPQALERCDGLDRGRLDRIGDLDQTRWNPVDRHRHDGRGLLVELGPESGPKTTLKFRRARASDLDLTAVHDGPDAMPGTILEVAQDSAFVGGGCDREIGRASCRERVSFLV